MAQLTGFPSITAAAEFLVTFGRLFFWRKARLWGWWGLSCAVGKRRAGEDSRPCEIQGTLRPFRRGRALSRPVEDFLRFRAHPHPSGLRPATFPLVGGRLGTGGHMGPPLRRKTESERWFGKLRRRNGAALALIFHKPRAQWPGRNRTQALLILRAGNVLPNPRGDLRNGGPGESRHWRTKFASAASPGDPLVTFPSCRFTMQVQQ